MMHFSDSSGLLNRDGQVNNVAKLFPINNVLFRYHLIYLLSNSAKSTRRLNNFITKSLSFFKIKCFLHQIDHISKKTQTYKKVQQEKTCYKNKYLTKTISTTPIKSIFLLILRFVSKIFKDSLIMVGQAVQNSVSFTIRAQFFLIYIQLTHIHSVSSYMYLVLFIFNQK